MQQRRAVLIGLGHAAAMGAGGPAWADLARASTEKKTVPRPAPPLDILRDTPLTLPDGAPTTLGAHLPSGVASLVSFWASWCAPCAEETRYLVRVRNRISTDQLTMIGLNIDRSRNEQRLAGFLARTGANFPQVRGGRATFSAFGAGTDTSIPRSYVFNAAGTPIATLEGFTAGSSPRAIDAAIQKAIAGQS